MSWTNLTPPKPGAEAKTKMAAQLSVSRPKARAHTLRLVIRTQQAGTPWLSVGTLIAVQWGDGEHHGKMRVAPGGEFRAGAPGGRKDTRSAVLVTIPVPAHITGTPPTSPCAFSVADGALVIYLPEWACGPKPKLAAFPAFKAPIDDDPEPSSDSKPKFAMSAPSHRQAMGARGR